MGIVIDEFVGNPAPVSDVISAIEADVERNIFIIHFTENAINDQRLHRARIGIVAHTFIPPGYPLVQFNRPAAKYLETSTANAPETVGDFIFDPKFGEEGDGVYIFDSPIVMRERNGENSVYLRIFMEDEQYTTYHEVEGNPVSVATCSVELPPA